MLHHQLQCFSGLRVDKTAASVVFVRFVAVYRLLMKSSLFSAFSDSLMEEEEELEEVFISELLSLL